MPKSELLDRARRLREDQTDPEGKLWGALRNRQLRGWKWKRQVPHSHFILDFYCAEAKLVVELDGGQHSEREGYDAWRTRQLEAEGLRVIRVWNYEVFDNLDGVCDAVLTACGGERPSPNPLPAKRGEG